MENKYFIVNIQTTSEGTAQSINAYDSHEQALSVYHQTHASNYISESLTGFAVVMLDKYGMTEKTECYYPVQPSEEE